jgi:GNAT superfamily N-acetyltransferase
VALLDVTIKEIDESHFEDEALSCVPSPESSDFTRFEKGVKDKVDWLRQRLKDYGYIGHLAYNKNGKPLGFVEFISSKAAPLPIKAVETTAIITCIDVSKAPKGQGIGTNLLRTTLRQLWKIGVCQVKTLVSRSPHWINDGIYRKHSFQLEKTFYKVGNPQPFDLFTLRLDGPQPKIEAVTQYLKPDLNDSLPVEVFYFNSPQCPHSSAVYLNHLNAAAKFSKELVTFKVIDSWKNQEMAKQYGSMYFFDTFINGRSPFFGPPREEEIEKEIQKEINRVLASKK